jgi:hypothetical protein
MGKPPREMWANSVLSGVPEGRHNVAHHGSGGEISEHDQKTPSGVAQGTQPREKNPLHKKLEI